VGDTNRVGRLPIPFLEAQSSVAPRVMSNATHQSCPTSFLRTDSVRRALARSGSSANSMLRSVAWLSIMAFFSCIAWRYICFNVTRQDFTTLPSTPHHSLPVPLWPLCRKFSPTWASLPWRHSSATRRVRRSGTRYAIVTSC
jgi:hypothetical protein